MSIETRVRLLEGRIRELEIVLRRRRSQEPNDVICEHCGHLAKRGHRCVQDNYQI